jgi:hypothetical protein
MASWLAPVHVDPAAEPQIIDTAYRRLVVLP